MDFSQNCLNDVDEKHVFAYNCIWGEGAGVSIFLYNLLYRSLCASLNKNQDFISNNETLSKLKFQDALSFDFFIFYFWVEGPPFEFRTSLPFHLCLISKQKMKKIISKFRNFPPKI
jgi:hypothetical protein